MSREEFSKLIGPYLDGELSVKEREKVEEYLAGSEEYRQMAAETEELIRIARVDVPAEVSDEEWKDVLSSVRGDGAMGSFTVVSSRSRWLAPLAGLAAVLVIGLFLWSTGPGSAGKPAAPKKDYASTEDGNDEVRIDTVEPEEKEKALQGADPRFEEE